MAPDVDAALSHLEALAERGTHPQDVAAEATRIAARWWLEAQGDVGPDRLVLLVQELRRWCRVASSDHARRWDFLHRAGQPAAADEAQRWAEALDRADAALHLFD